MKELIAEVIAQLDGDLLVLERRAMRLAELSAALATDDLKSLRDIACDLEDIEQEGRRVNMQRAQLRRRVGEALGVADDEVNLTLVSRHADEMDRLELGDRKERLAVALAAVEDGRVSACVVLHERARLNRAIVQSLLPQGVRHRSYSSDGQTHSISAAPAFLEVEI